MRKDDIVDTPTFGKVCQICLMPVKEKKGLGYFHEVENHPELETVAREVFDDVRTPAYVDVPASVRLV